MLRRDFLKGVAALLACPLIPPAVANELRATPKIPTGGAINFGKIVGYLSDDIAQVKRMVFRSGWTGSGNTITGSWSGLVEDGEEPWLVVTIPSPEVGNMVAFEQVGKQRCGIAVSAAGPFQTIPES